METLDSILSEKQRLCNLYGQYIGFGGGTVSSAAGYEIPYSCRFNAAGTTRMTRIPISNGNDKTWTFSVWFKMGNIGTNRNFLNAFVSGGTGAVQLGLMSSDKLMHITNVGPHENSSRRLLRDPHAWYHAVFGLDTTQSVEANRIKLELNGVDISSGLSGTLPDEDDNTVMNTTVLHTVGAYNDTLFSSYHDGYMAQVVMIDGAKLDATSFGEVNSSGVWTPIDVSELDFTGTNSFFLDFANASTKGDLGIDASKSATDSVTPGVSYWDNDGTGWDNGSGVIDSATAGYGNGSKNPISGNFTWTFTIAAGGQDGLKFGVFDAAEYSSFDASDDSGGMDTMTRSWFYSEDDSDMFYGSAAQSASPSIADGSVVTITRTGSTIKITDDGADEHTFSQTFAGPVFLGYGCKNTGSGHVDLNSVSVVGAACFKTSGLETNDRVTDTPTNNHCIFSPIWSGEGNDATFSDGNLTVAMANNSAAVGSIFVDIADTDGWYFEVHYDSATSYGGVGGVALDGINSLADSSYASITAGATSNPGNGGYAFLPASGQKRHGAGSDATYGGAPSVNSYIQCVIKSGAIYFGVDNSWANGSGANNQAWGSATAAFTSLTGLFSPAIDDDAGSGTKGTFTLRCSESDFEGTKPSGTKAINTTNLAVPAIKDSTDEIVVAIDPDESNIAATLATARSGWSSYVDILKNRSSSEAWIWRFSHDGSNEYLVSTTATYQSTSSLSGSDNWVGYSIRVDGTMGTRAGSVAHSGGDTTVSFTSVGTTRSLVILFPRSDGEVPVFHPDLASGKLLNLTGVNAETTDATIKSVGATSFVIDGGKADGTYDYLVVPESAVFKLGHYEGNGATDGTLVADGLGPKLLICKAIDRAVTGWFTYDSERDGYNGVPGNNPLYLNTTAAETTLSAADLDLLSNGFKGRQTGGPNHSTGATFVYAAWAESPFGGHGGTFGGGVAPATAR